MAEKTINLRGLKCPLPALRARKALTGMKSGDLLVAECTDPLTAIDIPNLINQTGDNASISARHSAPAAPSTLQTTAPRWVSDPFASLLNRPLPQRRLTPRG